MLRASYNSYSFIYLLCRFPQKAMRVMIVAVGSTEQKASRGHHALERATNGRLVISARSKPGEKAASSCGLNIHRVVDVLASFRREARQIVIADEVATVALSSQMFRKKKTAEQMALEGLSGWCGLFAVSDGC